MWEIVLYSSITFGVILSVMVMIYYIYSARLMKKRRQEFVKIHEELKVGKQVLFAGGLKGKVVRAGEEFVDVEISKDNVITVSRFSISQIL